MVPHYCRRFVALTLCHFRQVEHLKRDGHIVQGRRVDVRTVLQYRRISVAVCSHHWYPLYNAKSPSLATVIDCHSSQSFSFGSSTMQLRRSPMHVTLALSTCSCVHTQQLSVEATVWTIWSVTQTTIALTTPSDNLTPGTVVALEKT